mgnify:FL=1|jgi:membrane protein
MIVRDGKKAISAFALLVFWIWSQDFLLQYLRVVFSKIPYIGVYRDIVFDALFILLIVLSIPKFKVRAWDMFIVLAIVVVFMANWIFYRDAQYYINRYMVDFLLKILPLYIVGISLGDSPERDRIIKIMVVLSLLTIVSDMIYKLFLGAPMSQMASQYQGDMDRAYKLLPHCCLVAYSAIKRSRPMRAVVAAAGCFYILMLGTRGAALICIIFIALLMAAGKTSKWAITRILLIFGGIGAFISSSFYLKSITWMYNKATNLGLSVRIFDKLLSGTAANINSRDVIQAKLLDAIGVHLFDGYGLCGDRVIAGSYAHNIVLELWVEFGLLIGTMIFLLIAMTVLRGYLSAKTIECKGLIISLIFACFFKLFLSGSYLDEKFLFLLLGLCVAEIRRAHPPGYLYWYKIND